MDDAAKESGRARLWLTLGVLAWLIFAGGAAYYFLVGSSDDAAPVASAPVEQAPAEEVAANAPRAQSTGIPGEASLQTSSNELEDTIVNIGRRILEEDEEEPAPAPAPPAPAPVAAGPTHSADSPTDWTQAIIPIGAFLLSLFTSLTSFYFALSSHRRAERARASSA